MDLWNLPLILALADKDLIFAWPNEYSLLACKKKKIPQFFFFFVLTDLKLMVDIRQALLLNMYFNSRH